MTSVNRNKKMTEMIEQTIRFLRENVKKDNVAQMEMGQEAKIREIELYSFYALSNLTDFLDLIILLTNDLRYYS